jgi:hypothetical protein
MKGRHVITGLAALPKLFVLKTSFVTDFRGKNVKAQFSTPVS